MMKEEFEKKIGFEVSLKDYEKIEFVYMNSDDFKTKDDIVNFYKMYKMDGIKKEYEKILEAIQYDKEFKEYLKNLAYYSEDLVAPIKGYLAKNIYKFFKDKTIVKMLAEYKTRKEKEIEDLARNFQMYSQNNEIEPLWNNNCLSHSSSYKDVIADMTFREWWSKHSKEY